MALPAGRYFFTIDGANSLKEHISCDLSSTALTNIKTVSRQGTETAGVLRKHRIGATVSITDFAHILQINNLLNGTTNLNASTPLGYDATATISTANQFATKAYVDGVAIAGGVDASTTVKGISKLSTAPASPTNPIAVGDNDNRVSPVSLATVDAGKVDALAGTSGTPSGTNKYVTNDDVASAATASKVARRNATGDITVPTTPSAGGDAASKTYVDTFLNVYKNGTTTRDLTTADGNQTITHGLGVVPKFIRITAFFSDAGGTYNAVKSIGVYNGTTNSNTRTGRSGANFVASNDDTYIIFQMINLTTTNNKAIATFDATNITLAWTKAGSPSGTTYILWEAFA